MKKIKRKKEQGFTLIEVTIAITIFAIGILAVVAMQLTAVKGNTYSRRMTEGSNLALGKLEELAGLDYADSNLDAGAHNITENDYSLTWNVTDDSPLSNTKEIKIDVQWNEKGVNKRVTLTTIKPDII